jgi:ABC-2 type transport system permease protein
MSAEFNKQRRNAPGRRIVIFSMFLWPILQLLTTYYTVLPVIGTAAVTRWSAAATPASLFSFYASGDLAFATYFSLVASAWAFSAERQGGTLQALFLAPISRLALIIGNCLGALIRNAWLFGCFLVMLFFVPSAVHLRNPAYLAVVFVALVLPVIAWGACLNSALIFARDSGLLMTILGEPMAFLSGARVPTFALPVWAGALGTVLPLTGSLSVLRKLVLSGSTIRDAVPELIGLAILTVVFLAGAELLLRAGEHRSQRTGQLTMF